MPTWLTLENITAALTILSIICTVVSQTAAVLGSPKITEDSNKALQILKIIIDVLAGNYGKAKNN